MTVKVTDSLQKTINKVPAPVVGGLHNIHVHNISVNNPSTNMDSITKDVNNSVLFTEYEMEDEIVQKPIKTYKRSNTNKDFEIPKKTVKAKDATAKPVSTANYFAPLSESEMPSTSKEVSQTSPSIISKKVSQPPPLVIEKRNVNSKLLGQLKQTIRNEYKSSYNVQGLRVQTSTMEDFNAVQYYLSANKIQYFTYQKTSEPPVKVVLRGLPPTISEEEILVELQNLEFPALSVRQFKKLSFDPTTEERTKVPLPIWAISLHNEDGIKDKIKRISGLFHLTVKIEDYKGNTGPIQCFRCQRFGHKAVGCNIQPKCVKCGNSHFTKDCTKDPATPPTCCNCKGAHPANYRQCPRYQAYNKSQSGETSTSFQITNENFPRPRPARKEIPGFQRQIPNENSNTMDDIKEIISYFKSFKLSNILTGVKTIIQNINKQKDIFSKCSVLINGLFSLFENGQD